VARLVNLTFIEEGGRKKEEGRRKKEEVAVGCVATENPSREIDNLVATHLIQFLLPKSFGFVY